jgi:hypothetical protein
MSIYVNNIFLFFIFYFYFLFFVSLSNYSTSVKGQLKLKLSSYDVSISAMVQLMLNISHVAGGSGARQNTKLNAMVTSTLYKVSVRVSVYNGIDTEGSPFVSSMVTDSSKVMAIEVSLLMLNDVVKPVTSTDKVSYGVLGAVVVNSYPSIISNTSGTLALADKVKAGNISTSTVEQSHHHQDCLPQNPGPG